MGELTMINKIKNNQSNQGQIAIIVLLASAILLTLGMSASRKTVTDTKVNTDEELLKEAFNTAESGINNYLLDNTNTTYDSGDGNKATVSSADIGNANNLTSEGKAQVNTPQLFWLVNHNDAGAIGSTYYGSTSATLAVDTGYNGALKVDYYYIEAGVYKVRRLGCNYGGGSVVNGFDSNTTTCSNLILTGKALLLIVTPLGSETSLILSGSSVFPIQGQVLTSVGTAGSGVKTQVKTRNVYQLPPFFFESITAQNVIK